MRTLALSFILLAAGLSAADAQSRREFDRPSPEWCDGGDIDRGYHCEVREERLAGTIPLDIDATPNGGIRVRGWDRAEVALRARVAAHADTDAAARELVSRVRVTTAGGTVRADGPDAGDGNWSVSYEVSVPQDATVTLQTGNGGITVQDLRGHVRFRARNGGVHLFNVAGDVKGETTNGGLDVVLSGNAWQGAGLDVETTNGGVRLALPSDYSAELETGTTNGRLSIDFPITVQGLVGKRLTTTLGAGGAKVRAITHNGGVKVRRR